jgi:hypothetical protein
MAGGDGKEVTKEWLTKLAAAANPKTEEIVISPIARLQQHIDLFNKSRKKFLQSGYTEDIDNLGQTFDKAAKNSLELFGNIDRASNSIEAFRTSTKSFVFMSQDLQQTLAKTSTYMQALGFEAETLASIVDSGAYAFKQSGKEMKGTMDDLIQMSTSFAIPGEELAKNFRTAQQNFAYQAGEFRKNFKDLQIMARQTGLSFDSLSGTFGSSFDTFEGAATKAGQLNQILGKSAFNSIEMLNATEAERAAMVKKEFKGRDPSKMGKFELLAIKDTLGLGSVEETRKFLRPGGPGGVDDTKYSKLEGRMSAERSRSFDKTGSGLEDSLKGIEDTVRRNRLPLENALISISNAVAKQAHKLNTEAIPAALKDKIPADLKKKFNALWKEAEVTQRFIIAQNMALLGPKQIKAMIENGNVLTTNIAHRDKVGKTALADDITTTIKKIDSPAALIGAAVSIAAISKIAGGVEMLTGIPKNITALVAISKAASLLSTPADLKKLQLTLARSKGAFTNIVELLEIIAASDGKTRAMLKQFKANEDAQADAAKKAAAAADRKRANGAAPTPGAPGIGK